MDDDVYKLLSCDSYELNIGNCVVVCDDRNIIGSTWLSSYRRCKQAVNLILSLLSIISNSDTPQVLSIHGSANKKPPCLSVRLSAKK